MAPPSAPLPLVVSPDPAAQARQAGVLARLALGGAYHRQEQGESALAPVAEVLAALAIPAAVVAVMLTRAGQVAPLTGVMLLAAAGLLAGVALGIGAVAAVEIWRNGSRGIARLARAGFMSVLVLAWPAWLAFQAATLPVLNEVSTDLVDPPAFSTLARTVHARGDFRPGEATRTQRQAQAATWPKIRPLVLEMEPEEAFSTVMAAIKTLKWPVSEESRPDDFRGRGRIEAVVPSRLMRLPHDVTIRFRATGSATRVDIRARSRFGRHDFGNSAALINRLVAEIAASEE